MKKIICFISMSLFLLGCASQNINHERTNTSGTGDSFDSVQSDIDPCTGIDNCIVAAEDCDESPNAQACNVRPNYGGIKQEYVVKGCKVTIYNDGPVRMVHEKTGQFCNAPIPEDHDFGGEEKVYKKDGCTVTEYISKDGLGTATMDCP